MTSLNFPGKPFPGRLLLTASVFRRSDIHPEVTGLETAAATDVAAIDPSAKSLALILFK